MFHLKWNNLMRKEWKTTELNLKKDIYMINNYTGETGKLILTIRSWIFIIGLVFRSKIRQGIYPSRLLSVIYYSLFDYIQSDLNSIKKIIYIFFLLFHLGPLACCFFFFSFRLFILYLNSRRHICMYTFDLKLNWRESTSCLEYLCCRSVYKLIQPMVLFVISVMKTGYFFFSFSVLFFFFLNNLTERNNSAPIFIWI